MYKQWICKDGKWRECSFWPDFVKHTGIKIEVLLFDDKYNATLYPLKGSVRKISEKFENEKININLPEYILAKFDMQQQEFDMQQQEFDMQQQEFDMQRGPGKMEIRKDQGRRGLWRIYNAMKAIRKRD